MGFPQQGVLRPEDLDDGVLNPGVVIEGNVIRTGPPPGRRVEMNTQPYDVVTGTGGNSLDYFSGAPSETDPGRYLVDYDPTTQTAFVLATSPELNGQDPATFQMFSYGDPGIDPAFDSALLATAKRIDLIAGTEMYLISEGITLNGEIAFTRYPRTFVQPALSGAWTAVGQRPSAYLSVDGILHLSGIATGGVLGSQIIVLPSGPVDLRPKVQKTFPVNANGAYGSLRIDTTGAVVFTAGSTTNVSLSGVNFPIF